MKKEDEEDYIEVWETRDEFFKNIVVIETDLPNFFEIENDDVNEYLESDI